EVQDGDRAVRAKIGPEVEPAKQGEIAGNTRHENTASRVKLDEYRSQWVRVNSGDGLASVKNIKFFEMLFLYASAIQPVVSWRKSGRARAPHPNAPTAPLSLILFPRLPGKTASSQSDNKGVD